MADFDKLIILQTPKIYKFVDGEFFVFCNMKNHENKTYLYKISGDGGTGQHMFGGHVIGSQKFDSYIVSMAYINGYTFIGFDDGRILKISGTGGSGQNMFAISKVDNGFVTISGYNYLVGSHKFESSPLFIKYIEGYTIICFKNKKILKIRGAGGGGFNLFAINETSSGFGGVSGYSYYVGHQKLEDYVTNIIYNNGFTFVSTLDKRILKIRGTGGSGVNMFAVKLIDNNYHSISGYNYFSGTYRFREYVTCSLVVGDVMFFGLWDGVVIKIRGTGGTGQNLFNIKPSSNGYITYSTQYNTWLLGSQSFNTDYTIGEMNFIQDNLYITIWREKTNSIYKVKGIGGTGQNMFNYPYNPNYQPWILGRWNLAGISRLYNIDNKIFITLSRIKFYAVNSLGWWPTYYYNGHVIKVNGINDTYNNFFGLKIVSEYDLIITGDPAYSLWEGTENRFDRNDHPFS